MASLNEDYVQQLDDFMRFTGNKPIDGKTALFLVMGMTGAGKSTFIQHCTGRNIEVGHGLRSCTDDLSVHSFHQDGYHVHLIDTPGFDDTNRSDIDTLKSMTTYLAASFANGVRINGIIYLHRISDNRVGEVSLRNLRMFRKLSGAGAWANTVIGTTMWTIGEHAENLKREAELTRDEDFFKDMINHGAKLCRINGGTEAEQKLSGLRIISHLIQQMQIVHEVELDIQHELVLQGKTLESTNAGKELLRSVALLRSRVLEQLQTKQAEMAEVQRIREAKGAQDLQALKDDLDQKIADIEGKSEEMKVSLIELHDEKVETLQNMLKEMDSKHKEVLRKYQKEFTDMKESLELMRVQAASDEARWQRQGLHDAEIERKQRVQELLDKEFQRDVESLKKAVVCEESKKKAIGQATTAIKAVSGANHKNPARKVNWENGIANGVASGTIAAILGTMCVVS